MKTYIKTHFRCGDIHNRLLTDFPVPGLAQEVFIGSIQIEHAQGHKRAEGVLGFYEYCNREPGRECSGFYAIRETFTSKIEEYIRQTVRHDGLEIAGTSQSWVHFELVVKKSFSSTVTQLCSELSKLVKRNGKVDNWLLYPEMYPVTMVRMKEPRHQDVTYGNFILLKAGLKTTEQVFGCGGEWKLA